MEKVSPEMILDKKGEDMIILAHLYEIDEVQDIADFVGDSLELSRKAAQTNAGSILFCGVKFMAETAKILSPEKKVLLPVMDAGCPMADMTDVKELEKLKGEHPDAAVVCYVNSHARVKAISDICVTSSNAVDVVASLDSEEIIFVPDKNLGRFVSKQITDKKFYFSDGFCPVHDALTVEHIMSARRDHPDAVVLVHPECRPEVIEIADFAGSTAKIIEYAENSSAESYIIGTESGIMHQLKKKCPGKKFYPAKKDFTCMDMKKTDLNSVYKAMTEKGHEIFLDEQIMKDAQISIRRMLEV